MKIKSLIHALLLASAASAEVEEVPPTVETADGYQLVHGFLTNLVQAVIGDITNPIEPLPSDAKLTPAQQI